MGMFDSIFGSDPHTSEAPIAVPPAYVPPVAVAPPPVQEPTPELVSDSANAADVSAILENVIGREGNYSNNPDDSGGETMWGITVKTARAFGYNGDMKSMTKGAAIQIYSSRYWLQPRINEVYQLDAPIGIRLLDIAVNAGPPRAGAFLQRALNVLGSNGKYYDHLDVDGSIGDITLYDMDQFFLARGSEARVVLLHMITAQQSVFYIECAERKAQNESFEWGWQKNRAFGDL